MTPAIPNAIKFLASTSSSYVDACGHIRALIAECERYEDDLRDYFAGLAMQAMIGNPNKDDCSKGQAGVDIFPAYAYEMADAMLSARQKEQS